MLKDKTLRLLCVKIISAILFFIGCLFLSSCRVMKTRQEQAADVKQVKTADSAHVKKTETSITKEAEWWRETFLFQPRDTTINNFITQPTPPVVIIREGGNSKETAYQLNLDSFKRVMADSMRMVVEASSSKKETQVLTPMQIIGLCLGAVIVFAIISRLKISLK